MTDFFLGAFKSNELAKMIQDKITYTAEPANQYRQPVGLSLFFGSNKLSVAWKTKIKNDWTPKKQLKGRVFDSN